MKSGTGTNSKYSIDTSEILHAWHRYPPDVFPDVWASLDYFIGQGIVIASEAVLWELEVKDDKPRDWARQSGMFVPIDEEIQQRVDAILKKYPRLVDERKEQSGADPFVIALAQIEGCTVVTGEVYGTANRPKIPDVCDALGIRWIDIVQLFRDQGLKF